MLFKRDQEAGGGRIQSQNVTGAGWNIFISSRCAPVGEKSWAICSMRLIGIIWRYDNDGRAINRRTTKYTVDGRRVCNDVDVGAQQMIASREEVRYGWNGLPPSFCAKAIDVIAHYSKGCSRSP